MKQILNSRNELLMHLALKKNKIVHLYNINLKGVIERMNYEWHDIYIYIYIYIYSQNVKYV
jgi:hypothetical protein